jgi:hypothetical protein
MRFRFIGLILFFLTGNLDITLGSESTLNFKLLQPVEINQK